MQVLCIGNLEVPVKEYDLLQSIIDLIRRVDRLGELGASFMVDAECFGAKRLAISTQESCSSP